MQIKKATAADSKAIRNILKANNIKISVRKMNRMVSIGKQCDRLSKETALMIVDLMKDNGYLICQEDIIMSLIDNDICDTICVYIPAK